MILVEVYAMNKITVTMGGQSLEIEFDAGVDIEISDGKIVARSKYYQPFVYTHPAYGQQQQQIVPNPLTPTITWTENQISR